MIDRYNNDVLSRQGPSVPAFSFKSLPILNLSLSRGDCESSAAHAGLQHWQGGTFQNEEANSKHAWTRSIRGQGGCCEGN